MLRLSNYWALGLLILIPYAFYLSKKSLADLSTWRRWSTFGLRSFIILLLVLSLAGLKLVWRVDRLCVIFALDTSTSIPKSESQRAIGFIQGAMMELREGDEAGLVVFGKECYVEQPPKPVNPPNPLYKWEYEVHSAPSRDYTNLESAIKVASGLFPEGCQKRIVLITDGNENVGNALNEAAMSKASCIQIHTVPLLNSREGLPEVIMDGLVSPGAVELERTFELRVIVESTVDGGAKLKLFKNRDYLSEMEVELSAAKKNVFTFPQTVDSEGTYVYEVMVEPAIDTMRENNLARALVIAVGRPKILYIARGDGRTDYLYETLVKKGMEIVLVDSPSAMPASLSELQNYSAVILNDVPAYPMSMATMKIVESYVHDLGGGFVMIGGENSFGSGGYYKTPVEDVLPVKMMPEKKRRSLAMVLAIDKSGSMAVPSGGYTKIDLAKEAAVSVVEFLTDKDQLGIIAFDAEAQEIVSLGPVTSKNSVEDGISAISPGGGTNINPALSMAHSWLRNADTQLKHVILVSDGRSQQPDDSYNLVGKMAQDKITVSTIAIGRDADRKTMKYLAELGAGRYYETEDAGSLPRIFVKEAFVASELIMEGEFQPHICGYSKILSGISGSLPPLRGYVGTSPKEGGSVLITSDRGDPVLAAWQYGLGKAVAFTSDVKPKWAVEWLKWENFSKFWSQAVGWSLAAPSGEFSASANITGNKGNIAVDAVDAKGRFRNFLEFQASLVKPDLSQESISLKQSGPGRYEAEFDAEQMGSYLVRVSEMKNGEIVNSRNTGTVLSYSPEYKDLETNYPLLETLAADTGGKFRPNTGEVAAHGESNVWQLQDVWRLLVLASIPLFFLDVALRRVTISKEQLREMRNKLRLSKDRATSGARSETLISLRRQKERRGERGQGSREARERGKGEAEMVGKKPSVSADTVSDTSVSPLKRGIKGDFNAMDSRSTTEPTEGYTSRLLQAKKRARS